MIAHPNAPAIIGHHFNQAEGISMKQRDDGVWEFTEPWPAILGPEPTDTDVTAWEPAYLASITLAAKIEDQIKADPALSAIVRKLASDGGVTEQQFIDAIKTKAL